MSFDNMVRFLLSNVKVWIETGGQKPGRESTERGCGGEPASGAPGGPG